MTTVAFSPDGSLIATGTGFRRVKLWHATTGQNIDTFNDHRALVRAVSFSPDGRTLASASDDGTVVLRDLAAGSATTIDGHSGTVMRLAFSPDGATLASYSNTYGSGVKIWDTATRRKITTLRGNGLPIVSISISDDGTTLVSASGNRVILWDLDTYTDFAYLDHEDLPISGVVFTRWRCSGHRRLAGMGQPLERPNARTDHPCYRTERWGQGAGILARRRNSGFGSGQW